MVTMVDGQVREAIEGPAGFAATAVIFGLMAGMQVQELLDQPLHVHRGVWGYVLDYFVAFWYGFASLWFAYCLTKAVRQLRGDQTGANTD